MRSSLNTSCGPGLATTPAANPVDEASVAVVETRAWGRRMVRDLEQFLEAALREAAAAADAAPAPQRPSAEASPCC